MKDKIEKQIKFLEDYRETTKAPSGEWDAYYKGIKRGVEIGLNSLYSLKNEWESEHHTIRGDNLESEAIRKGVENAMESFLSVERFAKMGKRPSDVIETGIQKAFTEFMERHPMEIMDAIKGRERK